jgi:hypothetical protein
MGHKQEKKKLGVIISTIFIYFFLYLFFFFLRWKDSRLWFFVSLYAQWQFTDKHVFQNVHQLADVETMDVEALVEPDPVPLIKRV